MAKLMEADATGRTVQLTNVRLSFTNSLKTAKAPKNNPTATPTYSCNVIIEKDSKDAEANQAAIIKALENAATEFKKPANWWKSLFEEDPKALAFRKGSRFKNDSGEIYKGYEGNLVVICKGPQGGKNRPKMFDRHRRPVAEEDILDVMYSGSYADAQISFYGTDNGGTARLTCSVEGIRSRQEGERMGGGGIGVDADDWEELEDDGDFELAGGSVKKDEEVTSLFGD